jgi:hypothetical protein
MHRSARLQIVLLVRLAETQPWRVIMVSIDFTRAVPLPAFHPAASVSPFHAFSKSFAG